MCFGNKILFAFKEMGSSSNWTWDQNKLFESSLVTYDNDPDRFQTIAKIVGKTVEDVEMHYQKLVEDVKAIEAGKIQLPCYKNGEALHAKKK
ncbi:hypothetical protein R6Q59_034309 [Mikania micrantha]